MFARDLLPIRFPMMLPIAGYAIGDLDIEAFRYNGGVSAGNLSVTGTYFATRAGTTSYTWDTRGRLTGATTIDTSSRVIAQTAYQYDVLDRRIGRTENIEGVIVDRDRYLYQGEHVTAVASDSDGDGNYRITDRYLHSMATDAVLSMVSSTESTAASLNVPTTATLASADLLWTMTDHLGSVRDVVSANGDIVRHHVNYDAFGNRVGEVHRDTSGNIISADNTAAIDALFGYAGREWDDAIDLQYNRARWYDPNTGRWISQDPIGFEAGDANLYRYVGNGPMTKTDPSGLEEEKKRLRFIGFIYTLNPDSDNDAYVGKAEVVGNRLVPDHKHSDLFEDATADIKLQPVFAECVDPATLTKRERTRILLDAEQTVIDENGGVEGDKLRNIKNELTDETKREDVQTEFKPKLGKGGTVKSGNLGRRRRGGVDPELVVMVAGTLGLGKYLSDHPELTEFMQRFAERGPFGVCDPLWEEKIELEERYAPFGKVGIDGATASGRIIRAKP